MTSSLPPDLAEFANHFYSEAQVSAAVEKFLLERGLKLSDFAEMTEREFLHLFEESRQGSLDFLRDLNVSRVIPGIMRRLEAEGIELLPNQSVYLHSELRSSGGYNSTVHRVFVRKNGALIPLCNRLSDRMKRFHVIPFGSLAGKRLCSICASFDLNREWYRL